VRRTCCAVLLAAGLLSGCPARLVPGSRPYTPRSGEEQALLRTARRDVFPGDVRRDLGAHAGELVGWTGIVTEKRRVEHPEGVELRILIEHHYWNWREDFGTQQQVAFLSPRGEGSFQVSFIADASSEDPRFLPAGDMAVVYGTPKRLDGDVVVLDYRGASWLPPRAFATDVWDYGRDFLLRQDQRDFKVLRVPIFH
jgi:hypothetical protein